MLQLFITIVLTASLAAYRVDTDDAEQEMPQNAAGLSELEFEDVPTGEPVEISVDSELAQHALSVLQQQATTRRAQECNNRATVEGVLVFTAHRAFVQVVSGETVSLMLTVHREKMPTQMQPVNVQVQWLSSGHSAVLWPVMPCAFFDVGSFVSLASNVTSPLRASARHDSGLHHHAADSDSFLLTRAPATSLAQFWAFRDMLHRTINNDSRYLLPEEYDVRTDPRRKICFPQGGRTVVLDQGSCGSCWLFGALGAAGDRHCIASPNSMLGSKDEDRFVLSVQQALSCKHHDGCDGGTANKAYRFMAANPTTIWRRFKYQARCFKAKGGVVQEWSNYDCKTFKGMDDSNPSKPCPCVPKERRPVEQPPCPAELDPDQKQKTRQKAIELFELIDHTELPSPGSFADLYHPSLAYSASDVSSMMQASLHKDGPLYVSFSVYEDFSRFFRKQRTGVYQWDRVAEYSGSHAVVLVGWGQSSALPFWTLRNSWGRDWGDHGHFRLRRGVNECDIETKAYAPVVKAVMRQRNLLLEGATTDLTVQSIESGKPAFIWLFKAQCVDDHRIQADCTALSASILDFDVKQAVAAMAEQKKQLRCCCDTKHFKQPPGRCLLVPPQASSVFWKGEVCGKYNFGRGHTQTHHHSSACNDIMPSAEAEGVQLPVESSQGRLQVKVDLQLQRWLIGEHRLQLHVTLATASVDGGITALERKHEFRVRISEDGGNWAELIPGFTYVNVGLRTTRVAVRQRTGTYAYKDKRLVQVDAVCSSDCDPVEAVFIDMDTSHHPDGTKAAQLQATVRTYDLTSLTWQGDCAAYRPGNFVLRLSAKLRNSDREMHAEEKLTIPEVMGSGQLELWQKFTIHSMTLELKQEQIWDSHHHQKKVKIPVDNAPVTSADSKLRSILDNFFNAASFFRGGAREQVDEENEMAMKYTTRTEWVGDYAYRDFQEAILTCSRRCELVEARLIPSVSETEQASQKSGAIVALKLDSHKVALRWRVEDFKAGSYTLRVVLGAWPHTAKGEYSVEIPDQFYDAYDATSETSESS